MTVQHSEETSQLNLLSGLFSDFAEEGIFDRFSELDAAGWQAINWRFVAVFSVQQDLAVVLTDCENDFASSIRIRLPSICAQIGIRLYEVTAPYRLPVSACQGIHFRTVDLGRYLGKCEHRGAVRVEERKIPINNCFAFQPNKISFASSVSTVLKFISNERLGFGGIENYATSLGPAGYAYASFT